MPSGENRVRSQGDCCLIVRSQERDSARKRRKSIAMPLRPESQLDAFTVDMADFLNTKGA